MVNEKNEKLGPVRFTRLQPDVDAEVQKRAKKLDRPLAYVIRKLVEKALRRVA